MLSTPLNSQVFTHFLDGVTRTLYCNWKYTLILTLINVINTYIYCRILPGYCAGSGGRAWVSVTWGVGVSYDQGVTYQNASVIDDYLHQFESIGIGTPIQVPRNLFNSSAVYSITLTVRNFLRRRAVKAATLQVSSSSDIPSVVLLSPTSLIVRAVDEVAITAVGQLPSCAPLDR